MLVEMQSGSGGGGGGSVKSGTTAPTTTANEEIVINTGLSPINRFIWFAKGTVTTNTQIVRYDRNIDASKFSYASCGRYQGEDDVAFKTTGGPYSALIKSVSNDGVVTLMASSNANNRLDTGYWYAE